MVRRLTIGLQLSKRLLSSSPTGEVFYLERDSLLISSWVLGRVCLFEVLLQAGRKSFLYGLVQPRSYNIAFPFFLHKDPSHLLLLLLLLLLLPPLLFFYYYSHYH
ncbi:hypothetical protein K445DRAFT_80312 [Daldinia sp. EC12]|nr:hypothetical protein K445DRAFT_80312 [Daldinia sp. EC12]